MTIAFNLTRNLILNTRFSDQRISIPQKQKKSISWTVFNRFVRNTTRRPIRPDWSPKFPQLCRRYKPMLYRSLAHFVYVDLKRSEMKDGEMRQPCCGSFRLFLVFICRHCHVRIDSKSLFGLLDKLNKTAESD